MYIIGRRTKFFGGQNFRQQHIFSAILSAKFLSDKKYYIIQTSCQTLSHKIYKRGGKIAGAAVAWNHK